MESTNKTNRKLQIDSHKAQKWIQMKKVKTKTPSSHLSSLPSLCQILVAKLFEKGISPCAADFPEVKIKRQIVDHYLKGICTLSQQYGIYTIELQSPSTFHGKYLLQTDDVDIEFSKVFKENIKNIQHQSSQRANSIFTNEVFRIIYSYLSILEKPVSQGSSPVQTSKKKL